MHYASLPPYASFDIMGTGAWRTSKSKAIVIHAGVCLWLAQKTEDRETKLVLLEMARRGWR